jgi:hypothetical protein
LNKPSAQVNSRFLSQFTGPKSVVQQHSAVCKQQVNLFVRKPPRTRKKFKNPIVACKENAPKYLNRKYMCRFNTELQKEFPFLTLTDANDETLLVCKICLKRFSIAYKGRGSIRHHISSRIHCKGRERLEQLMEALGLNNLEEAMFARDCEQLPDSEEAVEGEEYEVEILTGKSDVDEILVKREGDHYVVADGVVEGFD